MLEYDDLLDREIVGLIASSLAIGRVDSILSCVRTVCRRLDAPRACLYESSEDDLEKIASGFAYRFYRAEHLAGLLIGMQRLVRRYGSLQRAFATGLTPSDDSVFPALSAFVDELYTLSPHVPKMVSVPSKGSGCKRLFLYLRWMIRRDAVDPGGWDTISPARLLVPVDVHIHNIALRLGITGRRSMGLRTTLEITDFFRSISPGDPARYDFALSRFGIHPDLSYDDLPDQKLALSRDFESTFRRFREDDCR